MKRKGFTLVELLVVIAIIALLMGILMPALAQVRRLAQRIMCGTNLSAIGKAMNVYSNDNEEEFPRSGGRASIWDKTTQGGKILKWDAVASASKSAEMLAFGDPPNKEATIASCFYLLIKYTDATPKVFVCRGDIDTATFKLSDATSPVTPLTDLVDAHDFGSKDSTGKVPGAYCSYSYHLPFNHSNPGAGNTTCNAISSSSSSASPLCADRNPFLDKNALTVYITTSGLRVKTDEEDPAWKSAAFYDADGVRNSAAHQREGQNVLYVDAHVDFEKVTNCGIENDNIYICWTANYPTTAATAKEYMQLGPTGTAGKPGSKKGAAALGPYTPTDAFLVNEYNE